jgi:hypothetical protein
VAVTLQNISLLFYIPVSWKLQIIQCRNAVHEVRSYVLADMLMDILVQLYKGLMPKYKNPNSLITLKVCLHVDNLITHLRRPSNQQLLLFLLLTSDVVFFTNNLHMVYVILGWFMYMTPAGIAFCEELQK